MLNRSSRSRWEPLEPRHYVNFKNWHRSCRLICTYVDKNRSAALPTVSEDDIGWAQLWTSILYLFSFEISLKKLMHCFGIWHSNIFISHFQWPDSVLTAPITSCLVSYSGATGLHVWEVCRICTSWAHALRVPKQSVLHCWRLSFSVSLFEVLLKFPGVQSLSTHRLLVF